MEIISAAKYLIYLAARDETYSLTPLKLQKMLYYAQGFSYVWDGKGLFNEQFEASQYGPVNREVYYMYSKYGHNDIPSFEGGIVNASQDELETIEAVWREYKKYNAFELVEMTHIEEPWSNAYKTDKIITNKSIKEYFNKVYV